MCQGILECEVLVGTRSVEGIMASGHVNRIKRPDTWLHRPMLQNVKKVLANPEPDLPKYLGDVRCWVNSGKHLLSLSFSGFDPTRTLVLAGQRPAMLLL